MHDNNFSLGWNANRPTINEVMHKTPQLTNYDGKYYFLHGTKINDISHIEQHVCIYSITYNRNVLVRHISAHN